MKQIEVVPYNPHWQDAFHSESTRVAAALGANVVAIHHIGSTSIPGIYAKPVIDMLVEVKRLEEVDTRAQEMRALGYQVMGEFGIAGRRYFRKDSIDGTRTHQIHVFEADSEQVKRHLAFRDYLIAHRDEALEYSELKRQLAAVHSDDANAYMDGKDAFIREIDRRAASWSASGPVPKKKRRPM